MAHGHEEFLSSESKASVNEYSESILKILSSTNACMDINTELKMQKNIQKSRVRREYYSLDYASVDSSLISKKVKMMAAELNNKGIRGYFSVGGNNYRCSIGKNKWMAKYPGIPLSEHLGENIDILITQVNTNQDTLTAELV